MAWFSGIAGKSARPALSHELLCSTDMFHDIAGHEDLTDGIIGCAIRVHEALGPGLLESVYRQSLEIELRESGFTIVNGLVIVELKAIERIAAVHVAQLVTYLKLTGLRVGLLMNFNVALLKSGTRRVVRPDLYVKR